MKIKVRSLLSVLTAVGIAAVGAANSAEAWFNETTAIQSTNSRIVAWRAGAQNVQSVGDANNRPLWMGAGDYRPNTTAGRDFMYVSALGGTNGGASVPVNGWTCVSSVWFGPFLSTATFPSFGSRTTAGQTAYPPGATGSTPTFAHVNVNRFRVECN